MILITEYYIDVSYLFWTGPKLFRNINLIPYQATYFKSIIHKLFTQRTD